MALIGIPFRVIDTNSPDTEGNILAGIAHELGHFLYWRLDDFDRLDIKHQDILERVDMSLRNKLNENQQRGIRYIRTWFEELFADFIGARIAKEHHLKTSKEMVIRNNKQSSNSGNNDYDHVSDILRPLISVYALKEDKNSSLEAWRKFLLDEFPIDPVTIKIEAIGENENQRKISRTADDLSQILLDTIDVISDEIKNSGDDGLFRPHFSNIPNIEKLSRKASRLAEKLNDKNRHRTDKTPEETNVELSALDVFLEPQILEAGEQSHPHTVTTPAHSYSFTIYHTHY
jgi:hypothetical protein